MATTWNPDLYLRYAAYRARSADDLLPRLTLPVHGDIYDLGCGPGTLTRRLKDKWPARRVVGVDSSPEMLVVAQERFPTGIEWQQADIAQWTARHPAALVFANASLQWLSDHEMLLPRLLSQVMPGGVLAIQLPRSGTQPYHKCIETLAASDRWRERFRGIHPHGDPLDARAYYGLLAPLAAEVDIWETEYHHVLEGENPVTEWISSTGLVPFLSVLTDAEKRDYLADYSACAAAAYPRQADGKVLFTMRRLFIVATRRA
jgi:trans-aconitate 2-methyltransferase